jgi:2-hydroxycyclohexanecarboxyl-CoA dehydrogenase
MSNAAHASRHAVVTGASRGIGAAIAQRLAHDGLRVSLWGRDAQALAAVLHSLPGSGHASQAVDVTDDEQVQQAAAVARDQRGPVAVLVNNAGAAESAAFARTDRALWSRMLAVNLGSAYACTHAFSADLKAQAKAGQAARIVNIASTAGQRGYAYVSAYVAAKHGLVGLTRALALEWATLGITVNAVCPGYTDTDLVQASLKRIVASTGRSAEDARAALQASNPQGRLVQPAEVADTVAWLLRPEAASITGQCLSVSGGEVMA